MDKKVIELLEDKGGNYILPFFWQHGEEEAVLREYMGVILACGIKAVCVNAGLILIFAAQSGGMTWI